MSRISIGFEFQTPDLSVNWVSTSGVIYQPTEFSRKSISDTLCVYADRPTNRRLLYKYVINQLTRKKTSSLSLRRTDGKVYTVPDIDSLTELMNDAEFIYTDVSLHKIPLSGLYDYMFHRMYKAMVEITTTLSTLEHHNLVSVYEHVDDKRPREHHSFPWKDVYRYDDICFLGVGNSPDTIEYNIQCTLGIPLNVVRRVMVDFVETYRPFAPESVLPFLKVVNDADKDCPSHLSLFEQNVVFLFLYSCRTHSYRKKYPFLVRHIFTNIFKLLKRPVFQKIFQSLPDETIRIGMKDLPVKEYAQTLYQNDYIPYKPVMTEQQSKQRIAIKVFEEMDVSTTFPLETLTQQTPVLVEFRYFHPFLMTYFLHQKKNKTTLVSFDMLKTFAEKHKLTSVPSSP